MIETLIYKDSFFDYFNGYDTMLISVGINGLLEIENVFLELSQGYLILSFQHLNY